MISTVLGNWVTEARQDGLYVLIEEIGGQGELGPFPDVAAARQGLLDYLTSGSGAARPARLDGSDRREDGSLS